MKTILYITSIFLLAIFVQGCSSSETDLTPEDHLIPYKTVMEKTLIINVINQSVALNSVFYDLLTDSLEQVQFAKSFLSDTWFYPSQSGYFFVENYLGDCLVDAGYPEIEGTNRYDAVNDDGYFYVQEMIQLATHNGQGWVTYSFENPATGVAEHKSSFIKAIATANWYIGSGYYTSDLVGMDAMNLNEANDFEIQVLVNTMAQGISAIQLEYESSFAQSALLEIVHYVTFNSDMSGYFFIYDFEGLCIAHGENHHLENTNLWNYEDPAGNLVIQMLAHKVQEEGSGFVDYYWINPATEEQESKRAYVTAIEGTNWFIGSGFYH